MRTFEGVDYDDDPDEQGAVEDQTGQARQSIIQTVLSCVAVLEGVVSVILMAGNESFPAFTLTPVVVGLFGITSGSLGLVLSHRRRGSDKDDLRNRNVMFIHYILNVLTATLSCIGTAYSCISGALCSGIEVMTADGYRDVIKYCKPHTELSSIFAFINGGVCILVGLWSMRGVCFFCYYGRSCGLNGSTAV